MIKLILDIFPVSNEVLFSLVCVQEAQMSQRDRATPRVLGVIYPQFIVWWCVHLF